MFKVLTVALACLISPPEATKSQCLKTFYLSKAYLQQQYNITLKLKRVYHKRRMVSNEYSDRNTSLERINQFFLRRNYDRYTLHLAIISRLDPLYSGLAVFYGNRVCTNGVAVISISGNYFKQYSPMYADRLAHEVLHLLGGTHDWGKPFDESKLLEQLNSCNLL